jgi:hypothetical protein
MNDDGFFTETWMKYYKILPIPVPNNCYHGAKIDPAIADLSLDIVLDIYNP